MRFKDRLPPRKPVLFSPLRYPAEQENHFRSLRHCEAPRNKKIIPVPFVIARLRRSRGNPSGRVFPPWIVSFAPLVRNDRNALDRKSAAEGRSEDLGGRR